MRISTSVDVSADPDTTRSKPCEEAIPNAFLFADEFKTTRLNKG
jgi:hypothetical protein